MPRARKTDQQTATNAARRVFFPLALRYRDAAASLGVSPSELRAMVDEGLIHRPYLLKKRVVLFDAAQLADDWDRIKSNVRPEENAVEDEGRSIWDKLIAQNTGK